jgi:glycerol-3-phosphate dehydrogenase
LLTVTGGKLTTFRLIALDALKATCARLPDMPKIDKKQPVLDPVDVDLAGAEMLGEDARQRLLGRYGADAPALVAAAGDGELESILCTPSLWAELRWAARVEGVVHLDDLLLRRVRLGLLTPQGGWAIMERVRAIVQPELGWGDARWEEEARRYAELWHSHYDLPEGLPDASVDLTDADRELAPTLWEPEPDGATPPYRFYWGLALGFALGLGWFLRRLRRSKR